MRCIQFRAFKRNEECKRNAKINVRVSGGSFESSNRRHVGTLIG